jgi:periplasmic iron binding protein
VLRRWAGPLVAILIIGGVLLVLVVNLNPQALWGPPAVKPAAPAPRAPAPWTAGFREYPIGDEVLKNHMRIAAVWLPTIAMEGMPAMPAGGDVIHLEADVHATEGNPNGFARDEFIPYLKIHYRITPGGAAAAIHEGDLTPMVARDGLHYGASLSMPQAGSYRLDYSIEPPSAGGLGRHSDPVTGVAPWWEPFEVSFDWDYPGPPR